MKIWAKKVDRVENGLIRDLMMEICILDKHDDDLGLFATDRERRNHLKLELASKLNLEAIYYKQKVRENGLKRVIKIPNIFTASPTIVEV